MPDNPTPDPSRGHAHAPLSRSSRRLLQLSLVTPRPCHCGPGCICLTHPERRALRRVCQDRAPVAAPGQAPGPRARSHRGASPGRKPAKVDSSPRRRGIVRATQDGPEIQSRRPARGKSVRPGGQHPPATLRPRVRFRFAQADLAGARVKDSMFQSLSDRLSGVLDKLTRRGALTESDVGEAMREVRRALLEADVALDVVTRLHRQGQGEGDRPGGPALGHARPDGRQDRPRRARRHARLGRRADRSQRRPAGRDHDGRPAGLGQDDDDGQDRQAAHRPRQEESADGLARHAPAGGAGAAARARRADAGRHAADRRRPDAAADRQARARCRRASAATTWCCSIPPAAPTSTKR